tara:strand:- start:447 stop:1115 length:669 start_codon:yes stop_codon:yes gene_type:complete
VYNLVTRRNLLISSSAFALTSCGTSPVWQNAYDVVRFMTMGMPDVEITREIIDKIPYASISAKIGRGPRSILILGRYDGEDLHWLSADNATVITRSGRVVKTAGFPENMKATNYLGDDPVSRDLHKLSESRAFSRSIDLDKGKLYGLVLDSRFVSQGEHVITIAGINLKTILVEEITSARNLNWNFSNFYWADKIDGFVWKSVQHIARGFPPVEIEVLKPAA